MNYRNLYDKIIANRQANPITEGYTERHHIVPRSLGGSDELDNLVVLTAREHFICHYLLAKMYAKKSFEWYKMNYAFMMMQCNSPTHDRYFNSRLYEALRGNISTVMSWAQTGKRNSQYGTRWIHSLEEKRSTRIGKNDPLPDGWDEGRVFKFDKREIKCKGCQKTFFRKNLEIYCSNKCQKERTKRENRYEGREFELIGLLNQGYSISSSLRKMNLIAHTLSNTRYGVGKWAKAIADSLQ